MTSVTNVTMIINKIQKFQAICGTITRTLKHKITKETRIKFYKTMATPALGIYSINEKIVRYLPRRVETPDKNEGRKNPKENRSIRIILEGKGI